MCQSRTVGASLPTWSTWTICTASGPSASPRHSVVTTAVGCPRRSSKTPQERTGPVKNRTGSSAGAAAAKAATGRARPHWASRSSAGSHKKGGGRSLPPSRSKLRLLARRVGPAAGRAWRRVGGRAARAHPGALPPGLVVDLDLGLAHRVAHRLGAVLGLLLDADLLDHARLLLHDGLLGGGPR